MAKSVQDHLGELTGSPVETGAAQFNENIPREHQAAIDRMNPDIAIGKRVTSIKNVGKMAIPKCAKAIDELREGVRLSMNAQPAHAVSAESEGT